MPYIRQARRTEFRDVARHLGESANAAGELNYVLTQVVLGWLSTYPESYSNYALVHGVLGDVWDELRRRRVNQYENAKRRENGEVYFN